MKGGPNVVKGGIVYFIRQTLKEFAKLDFSQDEIKITVTQEKDVELVTVAFSDRIGRLIEKFLNENQQFCQFISYSEDTIAYSGNVVVVEKSMLPFVNCILADVLRKEQKRFALEQREREERRKVCRKALAKNLEEAIAVQIRSTPLIQFKVLYENKVDQIKIILLYRKSARICKDFSPEEKGIYRKVREWVRHSKDYIQKTFP